MLLSNLLWIVNLLQLVIVTSSPEEFYIGTIDRDDFLCADINVPKCFSLAQLSSMLPTLLANTDNLTLTFLPGNHQLRQALYFNGSNNVVLYGHNDSSIISCSHSESGSIQFVGFSSVHIQHLRFSDCSVDSTISIIDVDLFLVRWCFFSGNSNDNEFSSGGAISISRSDTVIENSFFSNNTAQCIGCMGGALSVTGSSIDLTNCTFVSNYGDSCGALFVSHSNISIDNATFTVNSAELDGSAACFKESSTYIDNSLFQSNSNDIFGCGTVYVNGGVISSSNSTFRDNIATTGGALCIEIGVLLASMCHFENNSAEFGGALSVYGGQAQIKECVCTDNLADASGGVLDASLSSVFVSRCTFTGNIATRGAGMSILNQDTNQFKLFLEIRIEASSFTNNQAQEGILHFDHSVVNVDGLLAVADNQASGPLYLLNSQLNIAGGASFLNNSGIYGGAIACIQSQLNFNSSDEVTISDNTAVYGGGILLIDSTLHSDTFLHFTGNKASQSGGGIFAFQSQVQFVSVEDHKNISIDSNTATLGGGAFLAASYLTISQSFVTFSSNVGYRSGGAICLEQSSKIYIQKEIPEAFNFENRKFDLQVILVFRKNWAKLGGGIFIADSTDSGILCQQSPDEREKSLFTLGQCFLQTIKNYDSTVPFDGTNLINTLFFGNVASVSGKDIYGGLLDRCGLHPNAELLILSEDIFNVTNGFDYLKATVQFENIYDYQHDSNPTALINGLVPSDFEGSISSEPVQILFCDNTETINYPTISTRKGQLFKVNAVAVDQIGNPVNATINSLFTSRSGIGRLKEGQLKRAVTAECSELVFNIFSLDNLAQLQLYADGPCNDFGLSVRLLNISFHPCECTLGFEPIPSDIECECDCVPELKNLESVQCDLDSQEISIETNIWIGYINTTNNSGFIIHNCPKDYCSQRPVTVSLANSDQQCANNRSKILCGKCQEGLSLIFGSSRCALCSNIFILLLLPFSVAGILLVFLILALNMTVATGTLHGVIFYANMLHATSQFQPSTLPNFLTVFVSWLNLDLGIESCFYNGMESVSKVFLQLAFPVYLFLLIAAIIVICDISRRFSNLLANRNPIAALCTLILLSYSKLIRVIISALQFTTLHFPGGNLETVWLTDGNVKYFSGRHIPLFLTAVLVVVLGMVYTFLLLFGQWLSKYSDKKLLKWAKNTKYNAFIDAYQAPFVPKHRYWMGLLLIALLIHNIVVALNSSDSAAILSTGCITLGLLLFKLLSTGIYKMKVHDGLETLFLMNLAVLVMVTKISNMSPTIQGAVVNTSMGISFVMFVGLVCYHTFEFVLKKRRMWVNIIQCVQRIRRFHQRHQQYELARLQEEEEDEPIIDYNHDGLNSNSSTDSGEVEELPRDYTPPIIRYAVPDDQLREPALDILDPLNSDDYRPLPRHQPAHAPPIVTYTVIDGRPDHRNNN